MICLDCSSRVDARLPLGSLAWDNAALGTDDTAIVCPSLSNGAYTTCSWHVQGNKGRKQANNSCILPSVRSQNLLFPSLRTGPWAVKADDRVWNMYLLFKPTLFQQPGLVLLLHWVHMGRFGQLQLFSLVVHRWTRNWFGSDMVGFLEQIPHER